MKLHLDPIVIERREKRPTNDGTGHTSVVVGQEQIDLVCEIDEASLRQLLGQKAAHNRSGRAQIGHGAVTVSVTGRRRL